VKIYTWKLQLYNSRR